jgi:hypothetical protein
MKRCAPQNPAPSYFESVPILQQLASYTVTLQARKKAERPGDTNGNTLIRWRFIYRDNKRRKKKKRNSNSPCTHCYMVGRRKRREAKESEPRSVTVSPTRMENMDFR